LPQFPKNGKVEKPNLKNGQEMQRPSAHLFLITWCLQNRTDLKPFRRVKKKLNFLSIATCLDTLAAAADIILFPAKSTLAQILLPY
jgi:hypothetical protein